MYNQLLVMPETFQKQSSNLSDLSSRGKNGSQVWTKRLAVEPEAAPKPISMLCVQSGFTYEVFNSFSSYRAFLGLLFATEELTARPLCLALGALCSGLSSKKINTGMIDA